jgi:ribonuclease/clavin/mitogillin
VSEPIRKAASVIAARDLDDGFEMLVLERGASSRFLPGYVAFPGGSVDEDDDALAGRWFGDVGEAARACAVRELVEEVALSLTASGLEENASRSFDRVDAEPPSIEALAEVAHWIAPPEVPVRFDARFFAVEAPPALAARPDGVETAHAWWISPRALLEEWEAEKRRLYWPTWFTVNAIAACRTVADLRALRIETREPDDAEVETLPRSVFWQDR